MSADHVLRAELLERLGLGPLPRHEIRGPLFLSLEGTRQLLCDLRPEHAVPQWWHEPEHRIPFATVAEACAFVRGLAWYSAEFRGAEILVVRIEPPLEERTVFVAKVVT